MRSKTIFRQSLYLPHPDLTPLAGVFLALTYFFLLTCSSPELRRGLVLSKETPYVTGNVCFNVHTTTETIISLTADGRASFAISDTALQAAVFRQVGKLHGIIFTASQVSALGKLPYLATTIEQLPGMPIHSSITYQAQLLAQQHTALNSLQLAECIAATKLLAPLLTNYSTSFFLCISAEADASKVTEVIGLLQNQKINHFYLLAHSN